MAKVIGSKAQQKMERVFVGRAWQNKTKDGREYTNVKIDRGIKLEIDDTCSFQLWPNTKREGKKDADLRLSVLIPISA